MPEWIVPAVAAGGILATAVGVVYWATRPAESVYTAPAQETVTKKIPPMSRLSFVYDQVQGSYYVRIYLNEYLTKEEKAWSGNKLYDPSVKDVEFVQLRKDVTTRQITEYPYAYSIVDPNGNEGDLRGADSYNDARDKGFEEINKLQPAQSTRVVYEVPPLSERLQIVSDTTNSGYRMIVYQTKPGGEHGEMLQTESPFYWTFTRPNGSTWPLMGADSIEQAKARVWDAVRAEIPATTETIMYKNYKIDLTNNPATTPSFYAKITFPNGQFVPTAVSANSRDECLAKAKAYIDPKAADDVRIAAALAAAAKAKAEADAKGPVVYEYNKYSVTIKPHRLGRYGIINSPANNHVSDTDPYLTESEVKIAANKRINAHWNSLTALQQQAELIAYNKRKGITTPVPPVDTGKKAAQDAARAKTRATIISQLNNSPFESSYKNYKLIKDGHYVLIYDPAGNKLTTSFYNASMTEISDAVANNVMTFIDEKTGTAGFRGNIGYQDGNRIVFQRRANLSPRMRYDNTESFW